MLGVLHVIDRTTSRDSLRQLRLLLGKRDQVASVGPPPEALRTLGAPALQVRGLHCPLGLARLGGMVLGKMTDKASLIHAWSRFSASASVVAADRRKLPVLLSLPYLGDAGERQSLRTESARDAVSLTVPTRAARDALRSVGFDASRLHVLPPPAEPPATCAETRRCVRRKLGLADSDVVMVPLGEMTRRAGHKFATWVHALVNPLRPELKLVLYGGGPCLPQVRRFVIASGCDYAVSEAGSDLPLVDVLAAADVATLLCDCDCGVVDLVAALAAGVAVVGSRTPDILECTDNGAAAMLVAPGVCLKASRALLSLIETDGLAAELGARARALARVAFDLATVRTRLDEIYTALKATGA